MSPTIVLNEDSLFLAVGSPGGSTIITTVAEVLLNRIDRGMSLPKAIAAPRANQRNTTTVSWETSFPDNLKSALEDLGHVFRTSSSSEIGAVTGLEFLTDGRVLSAAEPIRRGGGDARVLNESRP